jgi:hypothetical protein
MLNRLKPNESWGASSPQNPTFVGSGTNPFSLYCTGFDLRDQSAQKNTGEHEQTTDALDPNGSPLSVGSSFTTHCKRATAKRDIALSPAGHPVQKERQGNESVRVTQDGEHVVSSIHKPSLTHISQEGKATGAAVIIAPGGGHRELWIDTRATTLPDGWPIAASRRLS